MTDAEYLLWLTSADAVRCLLVEATCLTTDENGAEVEVIRYLSSTGYVMGSAGYAVAPANVPAHTAYLPVVVGGVKLTETLSLDGGGLSYGDIEISNPDGEFDSWLDDTWMNRPIRMYTGDVRWPRSDFRLVLDGVIANIGSKSRTRLNIKLRDKLQRLNTPVTDVKVGGTTQSKDMLIPLVFGEVHNMLPVLIDPAHHTYQVHQGQINRVIEVRDNGAPVQVVADTVAGKFSLSGSPAGTITASVQGDKQPEWSLTVASIIRRLATGFGKEPEDRFTDDEIDSANFDAFDEAHPQPVGICATDKRNILDMCQALTKSIGAQLTVSRLGKLRLLQLAFPGTVTAGVPIPLIEPRDMLAQNIAIANKADVIASVKLAYCKNWQVQNNLQTGILEEHKHRFETEWDTKTVRYSAIAVANKLHLEPDQRETMLLRLKEAEPEAWRLLDMLCIARTTYRFEGMARLLTLELGQAVLLKHPRFGLDLIEEGTPGVVTSLTPDWMTGHVTVEVMV